MIKISINRIQKLSFELIVTVCNHAPKILWNLLKKSQGGIQDLVGRLFGANLPIRD